MPTFCICVFGSYVNDFYFNEYIRCKLYGFSALPLSNVIKRLCLKGKVKGSEIPEVY